MNAQEQKNLSKAIKCWNPPLNQDPNLKRKVWHRIDQIETDRRSASLFHNMWNVLQQSEVLSLKPVFATIFLILCVLIGVFMAEKRIVKEQDEVNRRYASQYIEMIDPVSKLAQMNIEKIPENKNVPSTPPTSP